MNPYAPNGLVLWGACLDAHGLLDRAEHVASSGFAAMTAFVTDIAPYESTIGLAGLRAELEVRGTRVNCVDVYLGWYPGHDPASLAGEASPLLRSTEADVLRMGEALGADFVSIAAPFGGPDAPFEEVVDSLGSFVDRANAAGLRPHLEVSNGSKVPDVATAAALLDAVGRPGLGVVVDTYNILRAGGRPEDVDALPLERIFQIQLVDGAVEPVGDRFHDSLHHRQLPGNGALPIADMVGRIMRKGPLPPIGPEVFSDALRALPAGEVARLAAESTVRLLTDVAAELDGGADAAATA